MTIQIHKEGSLEKLNPLYNAVCSKCGCAFSFNKNDGVMVYPNEALGVDEPLIEITCPYTACGATVAVLANPRRGPVSHY